MPSKRHIVALAILSLLLLAHPIVCSAEDTPFRIDFITNYKSFQFKAQEELIKNSKNIMPGEIQSLIIDAMEDDKSLGHRMFLLDAANAMASGYQHYHGGSKKLLKKISKLIKKELDKEKARNAELMKWDSEERFLGNFVMKTHEKDMEQEGLAPVIYPHWIHRIWFECKVCHQDIFVMQRWRNEISHKKIDAGKQCGVCHNGKMAFSAKENCESCHLAGKPGAAKLHDVEHIDHKAIQEVATKLGAEWNIDALSNGRMPVDRYGFIDWLNMKERGIFMPIHSLDKDYVPETRDNTIFFESKSKVKNVLFSHDVHSSWIKCSSCHPEVFSADLKNNIKMVRMSKGQYCGHCHGKVSFTFADCLRCHVQEKGVTFEGALIHEGKNKQQK
ncbi:hypothetical protein MNBD_GAMMA26-1977 [hydrothermal vent metagenome]|uniref:Cytochrome c7-like domain-containing protein n=1 Tax=hydrothermal vent metagenome TaxID=652676 RepID=A0A3B1B4K3_9ZZZZ